ncbi:Peptidase propeptide and YPEB domain-containing protein [Ectothiorhodospira magna]|uniref:Peptidase propeptide and YPEB domain-containing protein n=1 Tax=Ectothiorhodospira magna TaxID=867345 RepID=A0A1H9BDL3_9GAMM|nr:PepSY domain-containing protein [Ectothiorhodospira magna]SEP87044.1 Peptidase propeptide and YPEB domain-containing protein [Ectothiorhodospira magna]
MAPGVWLCLILMPASPAAGGMPSLDTPCASGLLLAQEQPQPLSLDDAVARVQAALGGRVLAAETQYREDGRQVHRIRILTEDQRVRNILVDPMTGEWQ